MNGNDDALELMKSGNKEALARIQTSVFTGDPCDPKHQKAINAAVVPFAERNFETGEMLFKKLSAIEKASSTGNSHPIEIPTPLGTIRGEGRDIYRIAAILLMSFILYMMWTDKDERAAVREDLKSWRHSQQVEQIDVPKTVQIK